jgi:hypothetical protein
MALESGYWGSVYTRTSSSYNDDLYYLAEFISSLNNYEIIDSYSADSSPERYQGDPIDNGSWTSVTDVADDNSWIVIQQSNPSVTPAWQAKFQCCTTSDFDDPSGKDYNHEGDGTLIAIRFSPFGGWNVDDLDFNIDVDPSSQASMNREPQWGISSQDSLSFITCDEDTMLIFVRRGQDNWDFLNCIAYLGAYQPKSESQLEHEARCFICDDAAQNLTFEPGTISLINESSSYGGNVSVGFLKPDHTWVQTGYYTEGFSGFMLNRTQPNQFDTTPEMDLMPVLLKGHSTWSGLLGELRLIKKAQGIGIGTPFGDEEWLCLSNDYCAVIRWDGTEDLRP